MAHEPLHLEWTSDRTLRAACNGVLPSALRAWLSGRPVRIHPAAINTAFTLHAAQFTFPAALVATAEARAAIVAQATAFLMATGPIASTPATTVDIPICYDAEFAPDLPALAVRTRLSPTDLALLHSRSEYTADFLGFSPGFAYLSGLPGPLHVPRRDSPRPRIEPGSVALAGSQCAVYPSATPGGWNIIGRTPLRIFDAHRQHACLIPPLATVRFTPIDRTTFDALSVAPQSTPPIHPAGPHLTIHSPGAFALVQDLGRPNLGVLGIPQGGALDPCSHAAANLAAGNPHDSATIEFIGGGLSFSPSDDCRIGFSPTIPTVLTRKAAGEVSEQTARTLDLRAGDTVSVRSLPTRCGYLAVERGLDVPFVLGSRSTALKAGFGGFDGRALNKGDRIPIAPRNGTPLRFHAVPRAASPRQVFRITPGFHAGLLDRDTLARLFATIYRISLTSDRAGVRLEGPSLPHRHAQLPSEPTTPGAVQLPPDGQPIILGPDGPVTGGYPIVGVVIEADLCHVGQLSPGDYLRFELVSLDDAWDIASEAPFS